jgi:hypothetical protein
LLEQLRIRFIHVRSDNRFPVHMQLLRTHQNTSLSDDQTDPENPNRRDDALKSILWSNACLTTLFTWSSDEQWQGPLIIR